MWRGRGTGTERSNRRGQRPQEHSKPAVGQGVAVGRQSCEADFPTTLLSFPHVFLKSSPRVQTAICSPSGACGSSAGRCQLSHRPSPSPASAPAPPLSRAPPQPDRPLLGPAHSRLGPAPSSPPFRLLLAEQANAHLPPSVSLLTLLFSFEVLVSSSHTGFPVFGSVKLLTNDSSPLLN